MLALIFDGEPHFSQCPYGILVVDAGNARHLCGHFDFAHAVGWDALADDHEILGYSGLDVGQGFFFGFPLGPAARKSWARNAVALVRPRDGNLVFHLRECVVQIRIPFY